MDRVSKDRFLSVYIGPVDSQVARAVIQRTIEEVGEEHPKVGRGYLSGTTYSKTQIAGTTDTRDRVFDHQRKILTYFFDDEKMARLLLGRSESGEEIKDSVPDPNYISYGTEFDVDLNDLGAALGIDPAQLEPLQWQQLPVEGTVAQKPQIVVKRAATAIEIPMTEAIASSRSLREDNDRNGLIFHTRIIPLRVFPLDDASDKRRLRVVNAFTQQIEPGENADTQYIQRNRALLLNALKKFNGDRDVVMVKDSGSSWVVEFVSEDHAFVAMSLKHEGINLAPVTTSRDSRPPYRDQHTDSRPRGDRSRDSRASSSRAPSRGGSSRSTRN